MSSLFLLSSYQKDNLIVNVTWAGSRRPTPKSMGQKDHLILVVVAATTTIFTFRNNTSEQYQRNTDIIPKLFDIVPKVNIRFIRSALGAYFDFRPQKAIKIR